MVHIYHLYDKKLQVPVYVGATKHIKLRFSNHLITTLKEYPNLDAVCLEVLDTVEQDNAGKVELFWINKYTCEGIKLLNVSRRIIYPTRYKTQGKVKKLSRKTIETIIKDAELYAAVAKILNVAPRGLAAALRRNGNKVNQYDTIQGIAKMLGLTPNDILVEEVELAKAV